MNSRTSVSSATPLATSSTAPSLTKDCKPPQSNRLATPDEQSRYRIVPQRLTLDRRLSTLRGGPQYRNHTHSDIYLCPANEGSDTYNRFLQNQSQRVYDVKFNYCTGNAMKERIPQVEWNPMPQDDEDFKEYFKKRFLNFLRKHDYTPEEASYFTDKYRNARDNLRNLEKDLKDKISKDEKTQKRKGYWDISQKDRSLDLRVREVIDKVCLEREPCLSIPTEHWTPPAGNVTQDVFAHSKPRFASKLGAYLPHFKRRWAIANAEYQKYLCPYEVYRDLTLPKCKALAAKFEEWWAKEEPLGAYPMPFEDRSAAAAKVPGYHSVKFVGRLAEVEVYAKFIHQIGISVRIARKRGYLDCKLIAPLKGDFTAIDEVVRIRGLSHLKRGMAEAETQKNLAKKELKKIEKEQEFRDDKIAEAIGKNLKGFKNMVRNYSGSTKDKKYVLKSLLGSKLDLTYYVYKERKRPIVDVSGGEEPRVSRFKTAKQQRDFEQSEDGDDESMEVDLIEFEFDASQHGTEIRF